MLDLYVPRHSAIHSAPPALKLLALAVAGTALFMISTLPVAITASFVALCLYPLSSLTLSHAYRQIRPVAWILGLFVGAAVLLDGWHDAMLIGFRFATLIILAGLLTLTTRSSDLIDSLTTSLQWLRPLGVNPGKVSLALSLALRFIPVIAQLGQDVRDAQRARGMGGNIIAIAIPMIIRSLKMADDIADAIDARGYDPE